MPPYEEIATIYDAIYSWKDYEGESRRLKALLRREGVGPGARVLDVACGTGAHLAYLARWFRVTGVDASSPMLAQARRKLPHARLMLGRMQSFRLRERFDAVLCLFSAIGYVRSPAEMRATLQNLARHLAAGGVLVIEPWLEPRRFIPRRVHLFTAERPELKIARITVGRRLRGRSILEMHYLVGTPDSVRYIRERHDMALIPLARLRSWLRSEGLSVRTLPKGFTGRGLLIARARPAPSPLTRTRPWAVRGAGSRARRPRRRDER